MNYRETRNYENCQKEIFPGVGRYDMPQIAPDDVSPGVFMDINAAIKRGDGETCAHCFVDDYRFERLWQKPDTYLPVLRRFKCVLSPDFSMYTDFPRAVQIFMAYKRHWLGTYWQKHGVRVIPTISWADEQSYEWCFDGDPKESTVAVSSVATLADVEARRLFLSGYGEMIRRLRPRSIWFYGAIPEEITERENIVEIRAFYHEVRARAGDIRHGEHQ